MSNTVNLTATNTVQSSYTFGSGVLLNTQWPLALSLRARYGSGVTADKVDGLYYARLAFVASTPQTLDLSSLTDPFGNAIVAARCRFFAVKWSSTTDNVPMLIGDAAATAWQGLVVSATAVIPLYPSSAGNDGWLIFAAPQTTGMVVDGSHKSLKFDPQTGAGNLDIFALFCST